MDSKKRTIKENRGVGYKVDMLIIPWLSLDFIYLGDGWVFIFYLIHLMVLFYNHLYFFNFNYFLKYMLKLIEIQLQAHNDWHGMKEIIHLLIIQPLKMALPANEMPLKFAQKMFGPTIQTSNILIT